MSTLYKIPIFYRTGQAPNVMSFPFPHGAIRTRRPSQYKMSYQHENYNNSTISRPSFFIMEKATLGKTVVTLKQGPAAHTPRPITKRGILLAMHVISRLAASLYFSHSNCRHYRRYTFHQRCWTLNNYGNRTPNESFYTPAKTLMGF